MINVLIPCMGNSLFFKDIIFPKPLIEINGKTMLEHVIENYSSLDDKRFIFVFNEDDCRKYHLDLTVHMLLNDCEVIKLHGETKGALCTCLMSINYINNDEPLIVANCDQVIDVDYNEVLNCFKDNNLDSGIITFENVHPRWSFANFEGERVIETAEKRPISKNAIAGFYYYKHGKYFIDAAKNVLLKQNHLNGKYYISSTINELILIILISDIFL